MSGASGTMPALHELGGPSEPIAGQRIEVSSQSIHERIEASDCPVVLRRVEGPEANELFFHCQPLADAADAGLQAEAIYRAIFGVLEAEGGSYASVVCETLFLRSLRTDLEPVRAARRRVIAASASGVSPADGSTTTWLP